MPTEYRELTGDFFSIQEEQFLRIYFGLQDSVSLVPEPEMISIVPARLGKCLNCQKRNNFEALG